MKYIISLVLIGLTIAYEDVPQATGLKSLSRKPVAEVRRAPVYHDSSAPSDGVPRAHGFGVRRASTGVRRAPDRPVNTGPVKAPLGQKFVPRPVMRAGTVVRQPMLPGFGVMPIPLPPLIPMMPLVHPQPGQRGPPAAMPNLLNLPGLTAVTGLPPMPSLPTIEMPTLPTFTMPPSFQRLMGITTPATPKKKKVVREQSEEAVEERNEQSEHRSSHRQERIEKEESSEKFTQTKRVKGLSSVSSRLPKFVSESKEKVERPEQNADWIVPF